MGMTNPEVQSIAGESAEPAPTGATGRWSRLARRPRWQLVLLSMVGLVIVLWGILVASTLTMETATVLVTEQVHGIANPNALFDFGDLPRTAGIEHKLTVRNDGVTDTLVMIIVTGDIGDFVTIDDSTFSLGPGEERVVSMELRIPATAEVDKRYSGRAMIVRLPYLNPF
jgi:hypothetical protein